MNEERHIWDFTYPWNSDNMMIQTLPKSIHTDTKLLDKYQHDASAINAPQ